MFKDSVVKNADKMKVYGKGKGKSLVVSAAIDDDSDTEATSDDDSLRFIVKLCSSGCELQASLYDFSHVENKMAPSMEGNIVLFPVLLQVVYPYGSDENQFAPMAGVE